jgi:hypothetical protein
MVVMVVMLDMLQPPPCRGGRVVWQPPPSLIGEGGPLLPGDAVHEPHGRGSFHLPTAPAPRLIILGQVCLGGQQPNRLGRAAAAAAAAVASPPRGGWLRRVMRRRRRRRWLLRGRRPREAGVTEWLVRASSTRRQQAGRCEPTALLPLRGC